MLGEVSELDELASAARAGDGNALEGFVRAAYPDVYTLAFRLTGHEEDARDVAQEVFLRAVRGLRRFRGDAKVSTWLYRITANCALDYLERQGRHRHEVLNGDEPVRDARADYDPEVRAESGALRAELVRALAALPPRLRAVVVLRDVYDLPHEAIAAELGISESAAKVRLHRARRRLQDQLFARHRSEETAHAV